ncbi:ADGRB1 [Mytilus edulis]|uniref:ADGRB1 n=1 Tax=Mytilus edulis TaxID=6550 RepID=A0A8S3UWN3_MYTED|nr:ADGRB1 [Mytilus edulis]
MDNNQIAMLDTNIFKGLTALLDLWLNENQITTLKENVFNELTSLQTLYVKGLHSNQITSIDANAFTGLTALREISLNSNHITTIDVNTFNGLTALQGINISDNPLKCINCNTKQLSVFLQNLMYGNLTSAMCDDGTFLADFDFDNCTDVSEQNPTTTRSTTSVTRSSQESSTHCVQHVDKFHTNWNKTAESTLATLTCTGEYTGNVSRYCSSDGKWQEPNYSNCISKPIEYIKDKTANLLSGNIETDPVTSILDDLENITRDNNELRSGDLLTSSTVLNDIAKYVTNHTEDLSVDQLEIFGSLCDNLLDEINHQSWEELNNEGLGGVTSLVNAVTEYTNAFNDVINDVIDDELPLVVVKENVVMQVGKASSNEITVPDRLKTSDSWISDSTTQIKLKKNICTGLTGYSSTFYRNISRFFPKYIILNGNITPFNGSYGVNSIIADFTIHGTTCSDYSLIIKFEHLLENYTKPFCGHWDFSALNTVHGAWSKFGSQVVNATDSYTICEYNHTTNFAILMSPGRTPPSHHFPLSLISAIGCGVSILFLVITILIHFVLWRHVKTDRTKTLMNLCVALIMSYVIFLAGITQTQNKVICSAIAVGLHFMFLTDFALMLSEGILIVRMVVFVFPTNSISHKLIPACWIVPACIVGITAGLTKLKGYGNQQL